MQKHLITEQTCYTVSDFRSQFSCYFDFHTDPLFVSLENEYLLSIRLNRVKINWSMYFNFPICAHEKVKFRIKAA